MLPGGENVVGLGGIEGELDGGSMLGGASMGDADGGNMLDDEGGSIGDAVLGGPVGIIEVVGGGGRGPVLSVGTVGSIPIVVGLERRDGGREAYTGLFVKDGGGAVEGGGAKRGGAGEGASVGAGGREGREGVEGVKDGAGGRGGRDDVAEDGGLRGTD